MADVRRIDLILSSVESAQFGEQEYLRQILWQEYDFNYEHLYIFFEFKSLFGFEIACNLLRDDGSEEKQQRKVLLSSKLTSMLAFHEKHITGNMITYLVVASEEISKAEYAALIKKKNGGKGSLPEVEDIDEVATSPTKARMAKTPAVGSSVTIGDTLDSPKFNRLPTGVHRLKNIPERSDIDGLTEKLDHFDMLSSHPGRLT